MGSCSCGSPILDATARTAQAGPDKPLLTQLDLSHNPTLGEAALARERTAALREPCPADPLHDDFPVAHLGTLGDGPGVRRRPGCARCPLVALCTAGR